MNVWTYYSPLLLGIALVLALNDAIRGAMSYQPATEWAIVIALALAVGIQCQLLMIGAQGVFAQVLPVPIGRSFRGPAAARAGWLLALWVGLSAAAALYGWENGTLVFRILGGLAIAALVLSAIIYIWNIPAAQDDFSEPRRRRTQA